MKIIATWNVNSLKMRLPQVIQWLKTQKPDLLALQETKMTDENFPRQVIEDTGYHVIFTGQKTFNGVAIISRSPAKEIEKHLPNFPEDPQKRFLAATFGDLRVINIYVPNGSSIDSDKYPYKLHWLEQLKKQLTSELAQFPRCIILGDFNIAPEDRDVYDPKAWEGQVLVSVPERNALKKIIELGFADAFRLFEQPPKSYSWWDYRQLAFPRNHGIRLDLVLVSRPLASTCQRCTIDREARKAEKPSDHAPVVLTLE